MLTTGVPNEQRKATTLSGRYRICLLIPLSTRGGERGMGREKRLAAHSVPGAPKSDYLLGVFVKGSVTKMILIAERGRMKGLFVVHFRVCNTS